MPDPVPPPDPNDPAIYPRLTPDQLGRVEGFAVCREYAAGEVLFEQGERDAPLGVIGSGTVEVIDRRPGGDVPFARVGAGNIVGDIAVFTGQPTVAACVAVEPARVLLVSHDRLKELVAQHSDIGDLLLTTFLARRAWLEGHGYGQAGLVGSATSKEAYRLREFLARNQVPFRWYDVDADAASRALLDRLGVRPDECPVLVCGTGGVARRPTVEEVADHLGLRPDPGDRVYDLVVAGAGPAGLAAAVYASSEGLSTLVLEADSPGGQAGTSSKIENYLGFLTGISGAELTRQATLQARKFGAVLTNPRAARGLSADGDERVVELDDGRRVRAKVVLVATGAEYKRLECPSCGDFDGRGVYYAASQVEASGCEDGEVVVAGGGNSAGQAVVFLAGRAKRVYFAIRPASLDQAKMSRYLIDRVERLGNVEVLAEAEVVELHGDDRLRAVEVCVGRDRRRIEASRLFVMIGSTPRTAWLGDALLRDEHGFVLTGDELRKDGRFRAVWPLDRDPYLLEGSVPGVFAAGDCRHDSVKRVAAAVGEGSMCVTFTHRRLAEVAPKEPAA
ncbi:MAG: FAD-dependent oxidoreductase [Gemmataceae bacterium]|nr:FAD-dependent oxidoreductase [Gemmataceae bacterium]